MAKKSRSRKAAKPKKPKGGSGRPPKAGTKPPGGAADKSGPSTLRMTPGPALKSLLSTCRGLKANVDSIVGKIREEIAYHKEKKNLNTPMFAILRRFDKMEAEKASENWHTLVHYMETSGVMAKIEAVGRLPLGDDESGGEAGDGEAGESAADKAKAAKAAKAAAAKAAKAAKAGNAKGGDQPTSGTPPGEPDLRPPHLRNADSEVEPAGGADGAGESADPPGAAPNVARPRFGQQTRTH